MQFPLTGMSTGLLRSLKSGPQQLAIGLRLSKACDKVNNTNKITQAKSTKAL